MVDAAWAILSPVPYLGLLSGLWYFFFFFFFCFGFFFFFFFFRRARISRRPPQGANRFGPSPKGLELDQISEAFT